MSDFHAMAPVFEPCGAGCACNDLTLICWGPVDAPDGSTAALRANVADTDNDCRCLICVTNRPRRCYCPDDCGCRSPYRFNCCGCAEHDHGR